MNKLISVIASLFIAVGLQAQTTSYPILSTTPNQNGDTLLNLQSASGTGFPSRTGSSTWANRTITVTGAGISISNGDGVSGNPTLSNTGVTSLTGTANQIIASGSTGAITLSADATSASTANKLVSRDGNANFAANSVDQAVTVSASGSTFNFFANTAAVRIITGSSASSINLPDATTLNSGRAWRVVNLSTGTATVRDAGSNVVVAIPGNTERTITLTDNSTANGVWYTSISTVPSNLNGIVFGNGSGGYTAATANQVATALSGTTVSALDLSNVGTLTLPSNMTIQFRRGLASTLGLATLADGEPGWTTDTHLLYIGDGVTVGGVQVSLPISDSGGTVGFRNGSAGTSGGGSGTVGTLGAGGTITGYGGNGGNSGSTTGNGGAGSAAATVNISGANGGNGGTSGSGGAAGTAPVITLKPGNGATVATTATGGAGGAGPSIISSGGAGGAGGAGAVGGNGFFLLANGGAGSSTSSGAGGAAASISSSGGAAASGSSGGRGLLISANGGAGVVPSGSNGGNGLTITAHGRDGVGGGAGANGLVIAASGGATGAGNYGGNAAILTMNGGDGSSSIAAAGNGLVLNASGGNAGGASSAYGGDAGTVTMNGGVGGTNSGANGGVGAVLNMSGGAAGASSDGGAGPVITMNGSAGHASGTGNGGAAGSILSSGGIAGTGGDAGRGMLITANGGQGVLAAGGTALTITANGGAGGNNGTAFGGNAGTLNMSGGAGNSSPAGGGNGGTITMNGSTGGNNNGAGQNGGKGGNAGTITMNGGTGGSTGTTSGTGAAGSAAASVTMNGATGGTGGSSGNGGAAGSVTTITLAPGGGGNGSGASAGAAGGAGPSIVSTAGTGANGNTGGTGGAGLSITANGGNGSGGTPGGSALSITGSASGTNSAGTLAIGGGSAGAGGTIDVSGGASAAGGSITTANGGGAINTQGVGSIGLGVAATRTTLVGSATTARTVTIENETGNLPVIAGALDVASGKTGTISNTLTFAGTDGSTLNVGAGGTLGSAAFTAASAYDTSVPIYVSTTGSDSNSGTRASPKLTLAAALAAINNSGTIVMLSGDYTTPANVMLNLANAQRVTVTSEPGAKVRVFLGTRITGGSFTQQSGLRYQASVAGVSGYTANDRSTGGGDMLMWVFEENTKEGIITDPMPQQKNKTHRLDHARLWCQTSNGNVEGGAARFILNAGAGTLNLSSADGVAPTSHTYWLPSQVTNQSFVYGGTAATDVTVKGIEVYYGVNNFDFSGCGRWALINSVAFGAYNEGILATNAGPGYVQGSELAANGNDGTGPYNTNSIWCDVVENDLWTHDNGDEGSSMHANVNVYRYGGLYEWNANTGVTDAIGAQFYMNGVYTRKNGYNTTGVGTASGVGISTGVSPAVNGTVVNWTSDNDYIASYITAPDPAINLSAITASGSTVTATTVSDHGYSVGQKISVDNVTTSAYNAQNATIVTVPTSTTFTYVVSGSPTTPGTVGSGRVMRNALVTMINPTVINPDSTRWAFGAGTGTTLQVYNPRVVSVTSKTAGAGTVTMTEGKFGGTLDLDTVSTYVQNYTPTSGNAMRINIPASANQDAFEINAGGVTSLKIGYDSSANMRINSTRDLILIPNNGFNIGFLVDNATRWTMDGLNFLPSGNNTQDFGDNTHRLDDMWATKINGMTVSDSTGTFTLANSKTFTVSNTLTFTGTDSSSVAFGGGGTVGYLGTAQTWSGINTHSAYITVYDAAGVNGGKIYFGQSGNSFIGKNASSGNIEFTAASGSSIRLANGAIGFDALGSGTQLALIGPTTGQFYIGGTEKFRYDTNGIFANALRFSATNSTSAAQGVMSEDSTNDSYYALGFAGDSTKNPGFNFSETGSGAIGYFGGKRNSGSPRMFWNSAAVTWQSGTFTTGLTLQSNRLGINVGDNQPGGTLEVNNTADQIGLLLKSNTSGQGSPMIRVMDTSGSESFSVDANGNVIAASFSTAGPAAIVFDETTLASGATLDLGTADEYNVVKVTGTTNVTNMTNIVPGKLYYFYTVDGSVTFEDGNNIKCDGGSNITATTDDFVIGLGVSATEIRLKK